MTPSSLIHFQVHGTSFTKKGRQSASWEGRKPPVQLQAGRLKPWQAAMLVDTTNLYHACETRTLRAEGISLLPYVQSKDNRRREPNQSIPGISPPFTSLPTQPPPSEEHLGAWHPHIPSEAFLEEPSAMAPAESPTLRAHTHRYACAGLR